MTFATTILNGFLFHPLRKLAATPDTIGLPYQDAWSVAADGVRLHGWFIPQADRSPTIFFLHGNAGNISHRLYNLKVLWDAGFQILILDYRGYGRSQGRAGEQGTYLDALAGWQWLTRRVTRPPIIFGRSLGGGVATWLAIQPQVAAAALILESTFTRGRDMAAASIPFPRIVRMLPDFYPTLDRIGQVRAPVLIIHGEEDTVIPVEHARRLHVVTPEPKQLYLIPKAGHNDTVKVGGSGYMARFSGFLRHVSVY